MEQKQPSLKGTGENSLLQNYKCIVIKRNEMFMNIVKKDSKMSVTTYQVIASS